LRGNLVGFQGRKGPVQDPPLPRSISPFLSAARCVCSSPAMPDFKHSFGVAPSDQNALNLFAGEWSSSPPASRPGLKAGETPLFDDPRITWARDRFVELGLEGGFAGRDVLELGPLE